MRPVALTTPRPIRAHVHLRSAPRLPQCTNRRLSSQVIYGPKGETVRRQHVRFKGLSMYNWRRAVTICMYGASAYLALKHIPRLAGFDISVQIGDGDDEEEEEEETRGTKRGKPGSGIELTEEDLEAAEDSFFIPMTFAQKLPKAYYKGSDPEWQEFIRIANDKKRQMSIWAELITLFTESVQKQPGIARLLGGDIKHDKHWLDMTFPDGPPSEYVRSGLEFGTGYIAWSRQRIGQDKQNRIGRILWPKALFDSAWAMSSTLVSMQWGRIAQALGLRPADGTSMEDKIRAVAVMLNKAQRNQGDLPKTQTDPDDFSGNAGATSSPASSTKERAHKALWPLPPIQLSKPGEPATDESKKVRMAIAMHVFAQTLAKGWSSKKLEPPKGTFLVHGVMELKGTNGRMGFDLQALYDPARREFVQIDCAIRHFKQWKQGPKGGN